MEYDPAPPFAAGSPAGAGPEVTAQLLERIRSFQERRRAVTLRAASTLKDT
jgi:cyclohexyl-isocyanide hydratase